MAIFESIAPALIGGALGLFGSQQRNDASSAQAQSAQNFSAEQFATRYQTTVKDMESAGLSPMLAYGQGGGSPPTGVAAPMENVGAAGVGGASQMASVEAIRASAEASRAQADASSAQAEKTRAETPGAAAYQGAGTASLQSSADLNRRQLDLVDANVSNIKQLTDKARGDTSFETQQDILRQTAWQLRQSGVASQESGLTQGQQRAVLQQTIAKLKSETSLLDNSVQAAKALDNIGATTKELAPLIQIMKLFIR